MRGWNPALAVVAEEPLGERIGSLIFWPLLAVLLGVLIWALVKKSRQGSGGSANPGGSARSVPAKTWTDPADYREHHRVAWSEDPAAFTPAGIHWPLAATAVLGICSGDPWDRLAHVDLDNARAGLQEAWGIRSRGQLLSRLYWILREGHRVEFDSEVAAWSRLDERSATEFGEQARGGDEASREFAWRLQQVRTNARGIRSTKFEAWDLARAAMLCRAGYSLGWLSEEEAVDTLNLLSARLQQVYSGWAELGEHFSLAQWYWGGNSGLESQQEDAHGISRQQALLDPQRGPWSHVPWSREVPASRLVLVDALILEELVVQVPTESPTVLARSIDEATAARLADRA